MSACHSQIMQNSLNADNADRIGSNLGSTLYLARASCANTTEISQLQHEEEATGGDNDAAIDIDPEIIEEKGGAQKYGAVCEGRFGELKCL